MQSKPKIAIIGAGLSGVTLARRLSDRAAVTLFEKSRGLGGRMSTRRAEPYAFDHGAQYFTAKTPAFRDFLKPLVAVGVVQEWQGRFAVLDAGGTVTPETPSSPRYVAAPAMNSLCKHLGADLDIRKATRVSELRRVGEEWHLDLEDGNTADAFDWVLCTAPAEQTAVLMPEAFSAAHTVRSARMSGCFALMLGFDGSLDLPWDAARVGGGPLGFIACNQSKPGRPTPAALLVQSTNDWAEAQMETPLDKITPMMLEALQTFVAMPGAPVYQSLHRWRYAAVEQSAGTDCLLDTDIRFGVAGDWCLSGRVEAAFLSARALARAVEAAL